VLAILSRQVPLIQFLIVFPQLDLNFLHVDGLLAVLRQINTLDLSVIGVCLLTVDDEAIIADFPLFPLGGPLLAAFPLHKNDTILEVISVFILDSLLVELHMFFGVDTAVLLFKLIVLAETAQEAHPPFALSQPNRLLLFLHFHL
jgi:hypothetical protein